MIGASGIDIRPDGVVLQRFLASAAKAAFIQGPVRSGKTTTVIHKLALNALRLARPGPDGVVRWKTVVVRNTYKQLVDTVIPSVRDAMPEAVWGPIVTSGRPRRMIRLPKLEWEWLFYAADKPEDQEDFKSLETADIWLSEYRYLDRAIVSTAIERVGQFPSKRNGGCVLGQVLGETNAPMSDHWSAVMSGQEPMPEGLTEEERLLLVKPANVEFFIQPPGVLEVKDEDGRVTGFEQNPAAENVSNLNDPRYYENALSVKTPDEVRTEFMNRPGRRRAGKAVWPMFREDRHVASGLLPIAGHPLLVGVDFGRTPAAVIGQHVQGGWRVMAEVVTENMGAKAFARVLKQKLAERFPNMDFAVWGDPAGEDLSQADDNSPFLAMRAEGVSVLPAPTGPVRNDWVVRRDAVGELLGRLTDDASAVRFRVDRAGCPVLVAGMAGQFAYPRLQTSDERYGDRAMKNRYSHVCDALQYMVLGGGEGRVLFQRTAVGRAVAPARVVRAQSWRGRGWGARR